MYGVAMSSKVFGEDSIACKHLNNYLKHLEKELANSFSPLDDIIKVEIDELRKILDGGPRGLHNAYDDIMRCYRRRSEVADRACEARDEALRAHWKVKKQFEEAQEEITELKKMIAEYEDNSRRF